MNLIQKFKYKDYDNDITSNIPSEGFAEIYEKDGKQFLKYYTLENPPEWAMEVKE